MFFHIPKCLNIVIQFWMLCYIGFCCFTHTHTHTHSSWRMFVPCIFGGQTCWFVTAYKIPSSRVPSSVRVENCVSFPLCVCVCVCVWGTGNGVEWSLISSTYFIFLNPESHAFDFFPPFTIYFQKHVSFSFHRFSPTTRFSFFIYLHALSISYREQSIFFWYSFRKIEKKTKPRSSSFCSIVASPSCTWISKFSWQKAQSNLAGIGCLFFDLQAI